MKCSGKNVALSGTLNSFVSTRWNSFYFTLKSLLAVFGEIEQLIHRRRRDIKDLLRSFNVPQLQAICEFHKFFHLMTKELETDTDVTILNYLPAQEALLRHIQSDVNDHVTVSQMKSCARDYLNLSENDIMPDTARVWTLFHPEFKGMENFSMTEVTQQDAIRMLQVQIEINETTNRSTVSPTQSLATPQTSRPVVRKESVLFHLKDKSAASQNSGKTIREEINQYINMPYDPELTVMEFWTQHANILPRLYRHFLQFAAIPATSSSVERVFSISAGMLTTKRARLNMEILKMLTFLNKNRLMLD